MHKRRKYECTLNMDEQPPVESECTLNMDEQPPVESEFHYDNIIMS